MEYRPKTELHSASWESPTRGQCEELGAGGRESSKQPGGRKKATGQLNEVAVVKGRKEHGEEEFLND